MSASSIIVSNTPACHGGGKERGNRVPVSVVIPTFNRGHVIDRAIGSVLNQLDQPSEIIVVDDCSSDHTEVAVAAYDGHIPLKYLKLERNGGGAVARNAGIEAAAFDFIAFLDSDDEWLPEHICLLMEAARGRADHFVVAGSALRAGPKPRVLPGRKYPSQKSITKRLKFVLSAHLAFQTSTLLMPRATARAFMFDPRLRKYQDWDLIFRMMEADVLLVLLAEATTVYHIAELESISRSGPEFSSFRFIAKHGAKMGYVSRARFVVLNILRRRRLRPRIIIGRLLCAMIIGGISVKEFLYYSLNSVSAGGPES